MRSVAQLRRLLDERLRQDRAPGLFVQLSPACLAGVRRRAKPEAVGPLYRVSAMSRIAMRIATVMLALGTLVCGVASAQAAFSTTVKLHLGQQVVLAGENLSVGFDSVRDDSRCPPDVQCIWAGDATVLVSLAKPATGPRTVVELHTNPQFPGSADYAGYHVVLRKLNTAGDQLTLSITKN